MKVLKQAKNSNPQGRWWIKADAFDVRKGSRESMRGTWSGDEDVGNGSLKNLYTDYKTRCVFVKLAKREIEKLLVDLESDLEFLTAGVEVASGVYTKAIQVGK